MYFPREDVLKYGHVSPTAFFNDAGVLLPDPEDKGDDLEEIEKEALGKEQKKRSSKQQANRCLLREKANKDVCPLFTRYLFPQHKEG